MEGMKSESSRGTAVLNFNIQTVHDNIIHNTMLQNKYSTFHFPKETQGFLRKHMKRRRSYQVNLRYGSIQFTYANTVDAGAKPGCLYHYSIFPPIFYYTTHSM